MKLEHRYLPFGSDNVLAVILGGGQGTRLFPLTQDRAKPAVPLGGKYRLVDVPISNCINSGLLRIFLLTQFNSASLHRHIAQSYKFDHFSGGFVELLAAEQTLTDATWYQGTADAVRKNLLHFQSNPFDYMLILSGDQLYRMDYRTILARHVESHADITVATLPVVRKAVPGFGILKIGPDYRITEFVEKPRDSAVQDQFRIPRELHQQLKIDSEEELLLASMGIYVFNRDVLFSQLGEDNQDFGKHVIPRSLATHRVFAFVFQGAWEDIGTISNYFESSLELTNPSPKFNMFDMSSPLFTRPRFLPTSVIRGATIQDSLVSDGCIVGRAKIQQSILGLRSIVGDGCELSRTIMLGNDFYEPEDSHGQPAIRNPPRMGIGASTKIDTAIIDKNARVGENCVISPSGKPLNGDYKSYFIRDGIIIIPKNAVIPHGTAI